jgi:hypothetical protein
MDSIKSNDEGPVFRCIYNKSIIRNIAKTEHIRTSNQVERFAANLLDCIGVKKIFGYNTKRFYGTGELINEKGISEGIKKLYTCGFERCS